MEYSYIIPSTNPGCATVPNETRHVWHAYTQITSMPPRKSIVSFPSRRHQVSVVILAYRPVSRLRGARHHLRPWSDNVLASRLRQDRLDRMIKALWGFIDRGKTSQGLPKTKVCGITNPTDGGLSKPDNTGTRGGLKCVVCTFRCSSMPWLHEHFQATKSSR